MFDAELNDPPDKRTVSESPFPRPEGTRGWGEVTQDVSAWTKLTETYAASSDGTTIVGYGTRASDGSTQAFRVSNPGHFGLGAITSGAPEPATIVLLTVGLLGGR